MKMLHRNYDRLQMHIFFSFADGWGRPSRSAKMGDF